MSILDRMKQVKTVDNTSIRTPMTETQIATLKKKLVDGLCMNVYPNQFDIDKPFRVALNYRNEFYHFGNFIDLNVAKVVGNIASMAYFQENAIASVVDFEAAAENEEFIEWLKDERNQEVLSKAEGEPVSPTDEKQVEVLF